MNTSYPCDVCSKIVAKNHNTVCCDKCDMWVHKVFNNLSKYCYRKLQKDSSPWFCVNCLKKEMPFSNLFDNQFKLGRGKSERSTLSSRIWCWNQKQHVYPSRNQ